MSKQETTQDKIKYVTIKHGQYWYIIPPHEFTRYWLPNVPYESKLAALKRGKHYKRTYEAYREKGSGKHADRHFTE